MVVFRWRTWTNASNPNYGGWNVDSIKAFSSSIYLPPITTPALNGGENPVLFYPGTELPERLMAPTEPAAVLPVNDETSCRPRGR
jgi:hypothetical protein